MEWEDIKDPNGEIDFYMEWSLVRSSYLPEEIQEMINKHGVQGMVRIVNEHFKMTAHGHPVMQLSHVGNRKAVIQY